MIGAREIGLMKKGAILINASRGTVVDIDALAQAIRIGHLSGAAIDVFPEEPKANDDEFVSPLRGLDNVILTPHIGGSTMEAQANIGVEVAEKLIKYSDNGTTTSSVNFPEVALPGHPDAHRLLHVHANVPGVMSSINKIFSDFNINIVAQYLQTNEKVGYVVLDINSPYSEEALEKFATKWDVKYPTIARQWRLKWADIITLFEFPWEIRRVIATTNAIESVNSVIRKLTRNRKIYPNEDSALKIVYLAIREASKKWTMPIRNWKLALNHFAILFECRLPGT